MKKLTIKEIAKALEEELYLLVERNTEECPLVDCDILELFYAAAARLLTANGHEYDALDIDDTNIDLDKLVSLSAKWAKENTEGMSNDPEWMNAIPMDRYRTLQGLPTHKTIRAKNREIY